MQRNSSGCSRPICNLPIPKAPVSIDSRTAQLILRQPIASQTEEFVFAASSLPAFKPGQFISVRVGMDAQNNPILRSYSLASSPKESPHARLVIRLGEDGVGSRFFRALQPGQIAHFTGPLGFFVNDPVHPGDVVYIATGTGFAPILPMVQETLARQHELGHVFLFWGVRHSTDFFFLDTLASLAKQHPRLQLRLFVSRDAAANAGTLHLGRITQPVLDLLPSLQQPVFYLCGSGSMIRELKTALQLQGIDRKKQIRTEAFFDS